MRTLRPGQETMLAWNGGAVNCRVVAAAGDYVLLKLGRLANRTSEPPTGVCSLTYVDGMIPMGWDGTVDFGTRPGELRFKLQGVAGDRRSAVRVPVHAPLDIAVGGRLLAGRVLDVSAGGMRFRQPGRLLPGAVHRIRLQLPNDGPLVDADVVVRTSELGLTCVEFKTLHAADAQVIGAWTVDTLRAALVPKPA